MKFPSIPPKNAEKLVREINAGLAGKLSPDTQFNSFTVVVNIDSGATITVPNQLRDGRGNRIVPGEWAVIDSIGASIGAVVRGDDPWTTTKLYIKNVTASNGQFRIRFMERPKITGDDSRVALIAPDTFVISQCYYDTGAGHGSTNNKIRRIETERSHVGTAITYATSAAAGSSWTINEPGIYLFGYTDIHSSSKDMGLSKNSSLLTTSILSLTFVQGRRSFMGTPGSGVGRIVFVDYCVPGDVWRAHTDGAFTSTTDGVSFRVIQIRPVL